MSNPNRSDMSVAMPDLFELTDADSGARTTTAASAASTALAGVVSPFPTRSGPPRRRPPAAPTRRRMPGPSRASASRAARTNAASRQATGIPIRQPPSAATCRVVVVRGVEYETRRRLLVHEHDRLKRPAPVPVSQKSRTTGSVARQIVSRSAAAARRLRRHPARSAGRCRPHADAAHDRDAERRHRPSALPAPPFRAPPAQIRAHARWRPRARPSRPRQRQRPARRA